MWPQSGNDWRAIPRPRSWRDLSLAVVALCFLASCSGERPTLVPADSIESSVQESLEGTSDLLADGDPTALADTEASGSEQEQAATNPDSLDDCVAYHRSEPLELTLGASTNDVPLCFAVGVHQRLRLANSVGSPARVTVGTTSLSLADDEVTLTDAFGDWLILGPNALSDSSGPMTTLWLVAPTSQTLTDDVVGLRSIGPVEIGQSSSEVAEAVGSELAAPDSGCLTIGLPGDPYSPLLTFIDGSLALFETTSPGSETQSGVTLGSSEADIVSVYGERIQAEPDRTAENRKLLVYVPGDAADADYRLVFAMEEDRVVSMRAGLTDAALAGDACG